MVKALASSPDDLDSIPKEERTNSTKLSSGPLPSVFFKMSKFKRRYINIVLVLCAQSDEPPVLGKPAWK